ncbi:MAG: carboxypeptidase M32 [Verrucomicrobiae bacterium]|nr:carboxypeptidase M32 [Verrucomicrobiae bacterium]
MTDAYEKMLGRCRELAILNSTGSLLHWDQETYMPPKAITFRAEQLAYFAGKSHQLGTGPEVGDWIRACEGAGYTPDSTESVNIRQWRRGYDRATKIPQRLVEDMQKASSLGQHAWSEARAKSDFSLFKPHLEKLVTLSREMTEHLGYKKFRYDALLDEYERGADTASIQSTFDSLRPAVVGIVAEATERSRSVPESLLSDHYPVAAQMAFNREVAEAIGYPFDCGRVDTVTHPFCTGLGPRDVRITTRYDEGDFTSSLYGVLHEAGHALYNLGLPEADYGTPSGEYCSLGIHESQSRLWENHVGRTLDFWQHWFGRACHHFPGLRNRTPEQIARAVLRVCPTFIRVEADECTYDLHIILRFGIESALINGDIQVAEIPALWNSEFEKMFGLKVPDDSKGCLQDVHWSMGGFGYFPTYTLGNLNASQLMRRAAADHPGLCAEIAVGQYGNLLSWLRQKIHSMGQRLSPQDLMKQATGEPTRSLCHVEYLRKKYLG